MSKLIIAMTPVHTSISKSKKGGHGSKKGNPRSVFFSKLMTVLAGDFGNEVSQLYVDGNKEKLHEKLMEVCAKLEAGLDGSKTVNKDKVRKRTKGEDE